MDVEPVFVFTDGSCNRSNKLGGIGIYMKYKNKEKIIKIGYKNTKIGRMEIKAVIVALKNIKNKTKHVIVYSDSQYVIKSINIWMNNWVHRGWTGIANTDLWAQFICEYKQFDPLKVKIIHVKGHTGKNGFKFDGNSIADFLANYRFQKFYHENDLVL